MEKLMGFPFNLVRDILNTSDKDWHSNLPVDIEGTIWYIISRFDKRVQRVIIGCYKEGKTCRQLGNELGMSHERIRQIRVESINKMQRSECLNLLSLGIAKYIAQARRDAAERSASKQISAIAEVIRTVADQLSKITGGDEISVMIEKKDVAGRRMLNLEALGLSVRSYNCLRRAGLKKVGDVLGVGDLSKIPFLGQKCLEEVVQKFHELGFDIVQTH